VILDIRYLWNEKALRRPEGSATFMTLITSWQIFVISYRSNSISATETERPMRLSTIQASSNALLLIGRCLPNIPIDEQTQVQRHTPHSVRHNQAAASPYLVVLRGPASSRTWKAPRPCVDLACTSRKEHQVQYLVALNQVRNTRRADRRTGADVANRGRKARSHLRSQVNKKRGDSRHAMDSDLWISDEVWAGGRPEENVNRFSGRKHVEPSDVIHHLPPILGRGGEVDHSVLGL
jgi:hypothetical protein